MEHAKPTIERATDAIAVFCSQLKTWIGAFSAALGGLDTLVFAGGIGEQARAVRIGICSGLGFLGVDLDKRSNATNRGVVSSASSRVTVRVIHTDEELMIATDVGRLLGTNVPTGASP